MYMKNKITVYTPTYNRGYCLHNLYNSLLRQTNNNFEWLIIDDGSTDNTKLLVENWIAEDKINIIYKYQKNKGKQEAVNWAHELIKTELNACVDSDDFLVDDAIDFILSKWEEVKADENIAGLVGLDAYKSGEIVGTSFPEKISTAKFSEFETLYKIRGDKKFVYKTSVIKEYPKYPSFGNEKFPAPGYLYRLIDQNYSLFLINKILCVVEYLPDGISRNKFDQFKKCPNSFAFYRSERMRLAVNYKDKFKNAIHYVTCSIAIKKNIFSNNNYKLTTLLAFPFGCLLYFYIKYTSKRGVI